MTEDTVTVVAMNNLPIVIFFVNKTDSSFAIHLAEKWLPVLPATYAELNDNYSKFFLAWNVSVQTVHELLNAFGLLACAFETNRF